MKNDFLTEQNKYERVREAFQDKEEVVVDQLKRNGLQLDNLHILIVAYKADDVLDIFAKKNRRLPTRS